MVDGQPAASLRPGDEPALLLRACASSVCRSPASRSPSPPCPPAAVAPVWTRRFCPLWRAALGSSRSLSSGAPRIVGAGGACALHDLTGAVLRAGVLPARAGMPSVGRAGPRRRRPLALVGGWASYELGQVQDLAPSMRAGLVFGPGLLCRARLPLPPGRAHYPLPSIRRLPPCVAVPDSAFLPGDGPPPAALSLSSSPRPRSGGAPIAALAPSPTAPLRDIAARAAVLRSRALLCRRPVLRAFPHRIGHRRRPSLPRSVTSVPRPLLALTTPRRRAHATSRLSPDRRAGVLAGLRSVARRGTRGTISFSTCAAPCLIITLRHPRLSRRRSTRANPRRAPAVKTTPPRSNSSLVVARSHRPILAATERRGCQRVSALADQLVTSRWVRAR